MTTYDPDIFSHFYWFDAADGLKYSANVLRDRLSTLRDRKNRPTNLTELNKNKLAIFHAYMMLIGFSLENLIKAVSIKSFASSNQVITDFEKLQKDVWQVKDAHNILEIADKCSFHLTEDERDLILRLTEFIVWAGRYPIPKKKIKYDEVFEKGILRIKGGDEKTIEDIFKRAKNILEEKRGETP